MKRPKHLPNFKAPPLDELVLGVQMAPLPDYTSVDSADVWALFRDRFPKVEEQAPLAPSYETFGGRPSQQGLKLEFADLPTPSRLWFVSEDENNLIQFQPDRFFLNWRKRQGPTSYPRYEHISGEFERDLKALAHFLRSEKSFDLDINQAEISYVNIFPVDRFSDLSQWLKVWNEPEFEIEGLRLAFPAVVRNDSGEPIGRLHHEILSAYNVASQKPVFKFTMTFRGKPEEPDIPSALSLLARGREQIVKRFAELTTDHAHKVWKRTS